MSRQRGSSWPLRAVYLALAGLALFLAWNRLDAYSSGKGLIRGHLPEDLPGLERPDEGFVSSDACQSCHPAAYASWHGSYHRTMTQVATPEAVVAPFDGVRLELFGHEVRLERVGDEFWADMVDPDFEWDARRQGLGLGQMKGIPRARKRIVLVTGKHHMQVFWVQRSGGALFQFPFAYLQESRSWVPVEDTLLQPPKPYRDIPTWNSSCDLCHSVAPLPAMDFETRGFDTEVAELGIACEACHGPGAEHVELHRNPISRYRYRLGGVEDPIVVNPAKLAGAVSSQVCGQCHGINLPKDRGRWLQTGTVYRAGESLEARRDVILPGSDPGSQRIQQELRKDPEFLRRLYWSDGMVRVSGRDYTGMVESKCFEGGELACTSCHSMHDSDPDDQLAAGMEGDGACLQCHQEYEERLESHTNHPEESSGSRCYNCHMPHTVYGLLKGIRSHLIDSPTVAASVATGRPNACNQCHLDRSLGWTQEALAEWYGTPRVELDGDDSEIAASVLWLTRGDAGQRALAAWSMGWGPALEASGTDGLAPFLARTLDDHYATVRYIAGRSLGRLPGYEAFEFDFVAPRESLAERRGEALALWRPSSGARSAEEWQALLIADGSVDRIRLDRLLASRDNRPLTLAE